MAKLEVRLPTTSHSLINLSPSSHIPKVIAFNQTYTYPTSRHCFPTKSKCNNIKTCPFKKNKASRNLNHILELFYWNKCLLAPVKIISLHQLSQGSELPLPALPTPSYPALTNSVLWHSDLAQIFKFFFFCPTICPTLCPVPCHFTSLLATAWK